MVGLLGIDGGALAARVAGGPEPPACLTGQKPAIWLWTSALRGASSKAGRSEGRSEVVFLVEVSEALRGPGRQDLLAAALFACSSILQPVRCENGRKGGSNVGL